MDESVLLSFDLPLVSVVVVCFKDIQITRQCLTHIFRQTYPSVEVIVVDNASPENIHEMVSREFPRARVICLERNSGFAEGHNVGIRAAQGKYIAIINNDALAGPDWLAAMVKIAEQNSDIGSVASIITDGNQPDRLDSCGQISQHASRTYRNSPDDSEIPHHTVSREFVS